MATVGADYDIEPEPRTAADVLARDRDKPAPPRPKAKRLTASVAEDAAEVVGRVFDEAERRDPGHQRRWVALVDGNNHQIDRIEAEASKRKVNVAVVVDLIHVLEYPWGAAWCFFAEADPAAQGWVRDRAMAVLEGKARGSPPGSGGGPRLPGSQSRSATRPTRPPATSPTKRPTWTTRRPWPLAPIATGVIEGACRHLVKDRMDITGARWSVAGAEAVLNLRAVRCNGDFDEYWRWRLDQERRRVHESRYAEGVLPIAA